MAAPSLAASMLPWITAGGTALAGIGSFASGLQGGPEGLSWGDINKNLAYQKGLLNLQRPYSEYERKKTFGYQRKSARWKANKFGKFADKMGVSRYALLGHAPSSGPVARSVSSGASPTMSSRGRKGGLGPAMQGMGQDIQRGVNAYTQLESIKLQKQMSKAEIRLMNAKADSLINQSQKPQDLGYGGIVGIDKPPESYQRELDAEQKGGGIQAKPRLTGAGVIRYMPGPETTDWVSESKPAQVLFWTDRYAYSLQMNKGHNEANKGIYTSPAAKAYRQERMKLRYIYGTDFEWKPYFKVSYKILDKVGLVDAVKGLRRLGIVKQNLNSLQQTGAWVQKRP